MAKTTKRKLLHAAALVAALLLSAVLSACPVDNDDNTEPEPSLKLTITQSGRYLNNTVIEMEASDDMAAIYYTRDGSEPTADSDRYNYVNKPRMQFYNPNTGEPLAETITIKAIAIDDAGQKSRAVTSEYLPLAVDESVLSDRMKAQVAAWKAMSGGTGPDNPIAARLPATITVEDVRLQAPSDESPNALVVDGLGSLFVAIAASEKYIALDLSDVVWKGPDSTVSGSNPPEVQLIPFCHDSMYDIRPGRDRLVSVKFPAGTVVVEPNSFRSISGLKLADFTGCSHLKTIDQYAFAGNANLEEVKLVGCTSLTNVEQYAFSNASHLQYLDFSQTSLTQVKNNAIQSASRLKFIELPATLISMGDYAVQYAASLEYVRYRNTNFRPYFGWANWLYVNTPNAVTAAGYPANHLAQYPELKINPATGKTFVIFTPDVPYWTSGLDTGFYTNSGASYHLGQHVALPETMDALRGDALLAAQEPYRGLQSITINFSGANALGTASGTLVAGYTDAAGAAVQLAAAAIANGTGTVTIGLPQTNLKTLDEITGQALTGRYSRDIAASSRFTKTFAGDRWELDGREGWHGEPQPWPRDAKFAILDLELQLTGGGTQYPRLFAESTWLRENQKIKDRRNVRYVYVDKTVTIYRRNKPAGAAPTSDGQNGVCNVFITLKPGWNLWETMEWWPDMAEDTDFDNVDHVIANLISHVKIPYQDWTKPNDDIGRQPSPAAANPLTWKPINWVLLPEPFHYPD